MALVPFLSLSALASARPIDRSPSGQPEGTTVRVFFSLDDGVDRPFDAVFPFERVVYPVDRRVATAALEALIEGPTDDERARGYFSELQGVLQGDSNCGERDLALAIDDAGLATVRFCRALRGRGGIGSDAAIHAQVRATLMQFPTVKSVRLIESSGGCLGDLSGYEFCLQTNPLRPPLLDAEAEYRYAVVRYDLLEARARAAEDPELVRPHATDRRVGNVRRLVETIRERGERKEPYLEWITFCGNRERTPSLTEIDLIEVWSYRVYDHQGRLLRVEAPVRVAQTVFLVRDGQTEWLVDHVRFYAEPEGQPPSCG